VAILDEWILRAEQCIAKRSEIFKQELWEKNGQSNINFGDQKQKKDQF
jgi:hypothetical protein